MSAGDRPGSAGALYVVSTPIGNMGDFSFRAVEVLREADLIVAEDTRHSRVLLDRYEIRTPVSSYHEHNEARATPGLLKRMQAGERVALISDAGTPLISDPGQRLVSAAVEAGITVTAIPGASAVLAALVASGLDAGSFTFLGFLPRKGRERAARLEEVASSPSTAVLYEAPNRVAGSLRELAQVAGADRPAAVARELTKQFEEIRRGTLDTLAAYYEDTPPRGEVVVVIGGAPPPTIDTAALFEDAKALRVRGLSVRDVAAELASRGIPRNVAYRIARESEERD